MTRTTLSIPATKPMIIMGFVTGRVGGVGGTPIAYLANVMTL
jgi:hypothetical protein